jgi:hypothetical protein
MGREQNRLRSEIGEDVARHEKDNQRNRAETRAILADYVLTLDPGQTVREAVEQDGLDYDEMMRAAE